MKEAIKNKAESLKEVLNDRKSLLLEDIDHTIENLQSRLDAV